MWAKTLKVGPAPIYNDIIWENLGKNILKSRVKRIGFIILTFIMSLLLLTPTYAVQLIDTLKAISFSLFD